MRWLIPLLLSVSAFGQGLRPFGVSPPIGSSLTFVNSAGNHGGGATLAVTYSPVASHLVVVTIYNFSSIPTAPSAPTDNATGGSTTYSQAYNIALGAGYYLAEYYTCNVKSGVTTITGNNSGGGSIGQVLIVSEFSGNPTSSCFDTAVATFNHASSSSPLANSITPSAGQNEVVIGNFANLTDQTAFVSSGGYTLLQTEPDNVEGNEVGATYQIISSTSGSYQAASAFTAGASKSWYATGSSYK